MSAQDCLPDKDGNYKFYVRLNQPEVNDQFNKDDLKTLFFFSNKASYKEQNLIENNILNVYKSFPTVLSEGLQRTITVHSKNKNLDSLLSRLTDIVDFVEIECYSEPFLLNQPYVPNDYSLITGDNSENRHLELINAPQAWCITKGDPDILIGITDTGIRIDHEDLVGKIAQILQNSTNTNHGTFVAGCTSADTDNGTGIASIGFKSRIVFSSEWGNHVTTLR